MIEIRKYIFGRLTRIAQVKPRAIAGLLRPNMPRVDTVRRKVVVAVEATSKDHAIERLAQWYPHVPAMDWDFIDEVSREDELGMMGHTLRLEANEITRH